MKLKVTKIKLKVMKTKTKKSKQTKVVIKNHGPNFILDEQEIPVIEESKSNIILENEEIDFTNEEWEERYGDSWKRAKDEFEEKLNWKLEKANLTQKYNRQLTTAQHDFLSQFLTRDVNVLTDRDFKEASDYTNIQTEVIFHMFVKKEAQKQKNSSDWANVNKIIRNTISDDSNFNPIFVYVGRPAEPLLSVIKGDIVELKDGNMKVQIIKYPSNDKIVVKGEGKEFTVAKHEILKKVGHEALNSSLSLKKGDTVLLNTGIQGIIVKYPSNKEISVDTTQEIVVVAKIEIISKS